MTQFPASTCNDQSIYAARERVAKVTGRTTMVTLCYEAGYDGFWLARLLEQRGIGCRVMEPASLQVNGGHAG